MILSTYYVMKIPATPPFLCSQIKEIDVKILLGRQGYVSTYLKSPFLNIHFVSVLILDTVDPKQLQLLSVSRRGGLTDPRGTS